MHRFTWGFAVTLPGGSLLLGNHEYWSMPEGLENASVITVRPVATF